jgi:ureidoglycolate hydrolase
MIIDGNLKIEKLEKFPIIKQSFLPNLKPHKIFLKVVIFNFLFVFHNHLIKMR